MLYVYKYICVYIYMYIYIYVYMYIYICNVYIYIYICRASEARRAEMSHGILWCRVEREPVLTSANVCRWLKNKDLSQAGSVASLLEPCLAKNRFLVPRCQTPNAPGPGPPSQRNVSASGERALCMYVYIYIYIYMRIYIYIYDYIQMNIYIYIYTGVSSRPSSRGRLRKGAWRVWRPPRDVLREREMEIDR